MKIEDDGQLMSALRELEGLELLEEAGTDDDNELRLSDPEARESRSRELKHAIEAYSATCFPGLGRRCGR
jgi:hypothetical protein